MGGASSRFGETAWDQVHGGLKDASETLDGTSPTASHTILNLRRPNIVNQRQFDVLDDKDQNIYTSQAVEGTTKDFVFVDSTGKKIFRVHSMDHKHVSWMVFSNEPAFDDQVPDHSLSEIAGEIYDGSNPMYRRARVDVALDKHAGSVMIYGPSDEDNRGAIVLLDNDEPEPRVVLKVEEIRSYTAQFQSFVPTPLPSAILADAVVKPPLTGYWVWEHSANRHQIKMHLAKGSDTALQCLVAIITNQVYVETQSNQET